MNQWHRCNRWRRFRLACPFGGEPGHEDDDDDDDGFSFEDIKIFAEKPPRQARAKAEVAKLARLSQFIEAQGGVGRKGVPRGTPLPVNPVGGSGSTGQAFKKVAGVAARPKGGTGLSRTVKGHPQLTAPAARKLIEVGVQHIPPRWVPSPAVLKLLAQPAGSPVRFSRPVPKTPRVGAHVPPVTRKARVPKNVPVNVRAAAAEDAASTATKRFISGRRFNRPRSLPQWMSNANIGGAAAAAGGAGFFINYADRIRKLVGGLK